MSVTTTKGPVVAVISFPGSNGDSDAVHAFNESLGVRAALVDYRVTSLDDYAALVLPGGFSYGDYLRSGAIARFAPAMAAVRTVCRSRWARSSASATDSRSLRRRTCFPVRSFAIQRSSFIATGRISRSSRPIRPGRPT